MADTPSSSASPSTSPTRVPDAVRHARAYLMRVAEPPAVSLTAFIEAHDAMEAAARVRSGDVPPAVQRETEARRHLDLADEDLAAAEKVGARLLVPEDPEWPAWQLLCLDPPIERLRGAGQPLGLWIRGQAPVAGLFDQAVSVIGARTATSYGEFVATEIGYTLGSAGMTVVSGAAYGIDGAAHRGALKAGGPTVAVLGCGVDIAYPAGHSRLLDSIASDGLIVSEYPLGTNPARHRFLVRNRLVAALSTATVVVEAGERSGTRNTATTAAALGKTVLAVPGPITSAQSVGCHDLIQAGTARLAGSVPELLEAVSTGHTRPRPKP
jgi:DNA processing protein